MPLRRALLLQQMGIEQWTLQRPQALKGASAIVVAEKIKLLIISPQEPPSTALLQDIYRALGIQSQDCMLVDTAQLPRLKTAHSPAIWLVGNDPLLDENSLVALDKQNQKLVSADWQTLQHSPEAKRQLWQQLQQFKLVEQAQ